MNVLSRLKQVVTISTVAVCISVASVSQATAAERYIVSGVESWDTLNIRSRPSAKSAIIGEIPASGKNVNSNGEERGNGRTTWIRITYNGVSGWVSKRYLATDYSFNDTTKTNAMVSATVYTPEPVDTAATSRTGSIYDAGDTSTTARSVYVGPGNGLPAINTKRTSQYVEQPTFVQPQPAPQVQVNTGNTHSHPANPCTRSIAHSHAGPAGHAHRYSCQGQATKPQVQQVVVDNNSHTHPRNQYSNAVTHSHASNNRQHSHNYGQAQTQPKVQVRAPAAGGTHTHPRNQFSNAVTHTHASNDVNHRHNYGQNAAAQQPSVKVNTGPQQVTHIHPQTPYNARTKHTHPGGTGVHIHDFLLPPGQRAGAKPAVQVNTTNAHTHPKNQFTNSVTHSHANGANNHSHSYGAR
ncbi:MAG: SH3 domain-containing protein [Leucothrix sp.]